MVDIDPRALGISVSGDFEKALVQKYNTNHDPQSGRFTSGSGGSGGGGKSGGSHGDSDHNEAGYRLNSRERLNAKLKGLDDTQLEGAYRDALMNGTPEYDLKVYRDMIDQRLALGPSAELSDWRRIDAGEEAD